MISPIHNQKRVLLVTLCGGMVASLCACASHKTDLLKQGLVSLDPTVSKSLSHQPDVFEQDGELVVTGKLDSDEATKGAHVDVWIVSTDGTSLQEDSGDVRKRRTAGPGGGLRTNAPSTYTVRFPTLPPKGSVVHVKIDATPHGKAGGD